MLDFSDRLRFSLLGTSIRSWLKHQVASTILLIHLDDVVRVGVCIVEPKAHRMNLGIEMVKPGTDLRDIGKAIQKHAEANHYSVVREYCGHGIGAGFHEEPQVMHYFDPKESLFREAVILEEGMCFTIEPMINLRKRQVTLDKNDGWTVRTKDRSLSAQYEHTILVTADGHEILTLRKEERA